jgi:hypothetical protein
VLIALFAAALLVARLLSAHFLAFFQLDEVSLAAGVAALVRDTIGNLYRYGPQMGYYRLVEGLDLVLGGRIAAIPQIMIWLSALAGTLIPVCGFFLFPAFLSSTERAVLAGVLAVNPILWISSTYGNSAMPSVALFVLAVTILSNRPSRIAEIAALGLFGAAVAIRADAVLAGPAIAVILYLRYRSLSAVALRCGLLGVVMAISYGTLFVTDAHMAGTVHAVTGHLTDSQFRTRFWDYLLWSTSPFLLLFAAFGLREMLAGRRGLLAAVGIWCLPFFMFYFGATTTPRYFLPTTVPIGVATAVGLVALVPLMAPLKRGLAVTVVAAFSVVHLFVGLGSFAPGSLKNLLTQAAFETGVGPMWTGALLYQSYFVPGFLVRSVRHPGFGRLNDTQQALDTALAEVGAGRERGHTIVVLMGGWNGHALHYYAPLHGARYLSRQPGLEFGSETWMALGGARIMSINRGADVFRKMRALPVADGDEVWVMAYKPGDERLVQDRVPPSVSLVAIGDTTRQVRRFRLTTSGP